MLKLVNLKQNKKYIQNAKELYNSAFPPAERMPFNLLMAKAKGSNVTFWAVIDEDKFKGLTYTVWHNDIVFIFYLAVAESERGNGIGTKILNLIKEQFLNCRLVLNIEALDESSDNNDERIRRREFYVKNGFFGAGYNVKEYSVTYENMCFSPDGRAVTKDEYFKLIEAFCGKLIYFFYKKMSK